MIRALASYKDHSGCDYHRLRLPFQYSEGYLDNGAFAAADGDLEKLLRIAQVVVYNREFAVPGVDLGAARKQHGFKIVLDLDDFWELNPGHYMADYYRRERIPEKIVRNIRQADAVTVTTGRLADKVKPLNRNVYVIPNALPFGHGQFVAPEGAESANFTFIYAGQKSHLQDIRLLKDTMRQLADEPFAGIGFALAGYQEGKDGIWQAMESVMSAGGALKSYKRIYNRPLQEYMKAYHEASAVLVPLHQNNFNRHKSNLKLLEAGAMKLPVICQRVPPYSDSPGAPVLWVDSPADWYKHIKYLADNRQAALDLGAALHDWANTNYNLFTWNKARFELYKEIINR